MHVENHPGPVGAVVSGLSLQEPMDEATFARIRALILDRAVVSFAGQDRLDEAGQVAFSRRFDGEQRAVPARKWPCPGRVCRPPARTRRPCCCFQRKLRARPRSRA